MHAADRQAAQVGVGREVGDQRLKGGTLGVGRCGDVVLQHVKQHRKILSLRLRVERCGAGLGVGVDDGEVDLVLFGAHVEEQLVDLVHDFGRARVGAVDLVDDQYHRQLGGQRLAQHEAGLGEWALGGIHQ